MSNTDYALLRVGIVGAGLMGRWHSKFVKRHGAQLVSILDKDYATAMRLSKELGGSHQIFTDIDEMLLQSQLDVIHICTPLNSHFSIAMKAINSGVHIVIEKPVANTADETQLLMDESDKRNVKVCPVHQFGFQEGVLKAISEIDSLGDLLHVRFTTGSAGGEGINKAALNEIVADIIPHPLSVLQRLRPGFSLNTTHWMGLSSSEGELQVIGLANDVAIDIYISMNTRPTRCEMELFCRNGRMILNFFHGYVIIERGGVSRIRKILQPFRYALNEFYVASTNIVKRLVTKELAYPGLSYLIRDFYNAIINGETSPINSLDVMAIAIVRDKLISKFLTDLSVEKVN